MTIIREDGHNAFYVHKRKDGGEIHCYGHVEEDSNFSLACDNEEYDTIVTDIDTTKTNTWFKVCNYLLNNYRSDIEQIETC